MTSREPWRRGAPPLLALILLGALSALSCGGSSGGASDAAQQVSDADARLRGSWTLVAFQPDVPLEPMLAALLAMQIGHLAVQFDRGQATATGTGVQATRTYRITGATMNDFTATLFDDTGVAYQVEAAFDGNALRFHALTSPWTGQGVLAR
jgi:hypothetical protein